MARRVEEVAGTDRVVVMDVPLLTVHAGYEFAATIVVDVPVETAVARLVDQRGMGEADARARIAKQITREERLALADRVIDNSGDRASLEAQVDELWDWIRRLPPSAARPAESPA